LAVVVVAPVLAIREAAVDFIDDLSSS
jgi:hypothetical protein